MSLARSRAVPAGRFARSDDRDAAELLDPSWVVRLTARIHGRALDRALIDGADPSATPQMAARAARLTTKSIRVGTADGLERLVRVEREAPALWRVLPCRRATRANAAELLALAAILRGPAPVYARGVAILRGLLTDGTGPAYTDRRGGALADQLRNARIAIGG
jgi:hypothetical protein